MSEAAAIEITRTPRTRESLLRDLREIGVSPGTTMIVHSSLSSPGWVCGGPVTVVQALLDAVTTAGTIVMPTHSGEYTDPANWQHPPVPSEWWPIIREAMPAFDPRITPTRKMGRIVEVFRTCPDVLRSSHPVVSFAAWGRHANHIVSDHALDYSLGERSPLARVYDLDGSVLLIGVGYDRNTSFHLAEYRTPGSTHIECGAPIADATGTAWKVYRDIDLDSDPFAKIGQAFEQSERIALARIGSAEARLFSQRRAVDFAATRLAARQAGDNC